MSKTHSEEMKELYEIELELKDDYTYCLNEDTCMHRRGCRRWIGNYTDDQAIQESDENTEGYVDESKCIPNYKDKECTNVFGFLDRFRLSTGEPFATGFTNKD